MSTVQQQQSAGSVAIDTTHPDYSKYENAAFRVTTCCDGEDAMIAAGFKLVPHPDVKHTITDPDGSRYKAFLRRAVFMNAVSRTLVGCLGIIFGKPATITAKGDLELMVNDADGEGKPLHQMVRDATSEILKTSRGGILVEYTGAGTQTAVNKGRVQFRLMGKKNIRNWRVVNQQLRLLVLKYTEALDDPNGFDYAEKTVWEEYRIINGQCLGRRWELAPNGSAQPSQATAGELVALLDLKGNPLKEIPFAWLGAENNDSDPDTPVLGDLASLNVKHFAREADVAEAAHIMALPMLVMTGLNQAWVDKNLKNGVVMGSSTGLPLPVNADAKLLQAEERNLLITVIERIERQMAMIGARLVERGTAARTAAQANDEAQTDNSVLSLVATNIERGFMKAFEIAAQFARGEAEIVLSKKYEVATLDSQALQTLMGAVQSGQFLLEDFIRYLQREGLVDAEVDPDQYAADLRAATPLNSMKQSLDADGNPIPIAQITAGGQQPNNNPANEENPEKGDNPPAKKDTKKDAK